MINLNKLIIGGLFVLLIIHYFHSNLKETFVSSNEGKTLHGLFKNEFTDIKKRKDNGSDEYTKKLLHTVSAHLESLHVEKTIDLIRKNSHIKGSNDKHVIDFTPLNTSQVEQLNHINHINNLNGAIKNSIEYNNRTPSGDNILKGMFG